MKFMIDAQLPVRLKKWFSKNGYDALHAVDLPKKEFTSDMEIIAFAERESRIVVTKDSDFYKYHLIKGLPKRILYVTTGNMVNKEFLRLFELNFETIKNHFLSGKNVIEMSNTSIIIHS